MQQPFDAGLLLIPLSFINLLCCPNSLLPTTAVGLLPAGDPADTHRGAEWALLAGGQPRTHRRAPAAAAQAGAAARPLASLRLEMYH